MPRINVTAVRLDDDECEFLAAMADKSHHAPATLAYIVIREYLELHGFRPPKKKDGFTVSHAECN